MIVLFISLFIAAVIINTFYEKKVFNEIVFSLELDRNTAEIGDEIIITTTLSNNKWIPFDYVRIYETYPKCCINKKYVDNEINSVKENSQTFSGNTISVSDTFFMKGKRKNSFERTISFDRRGRYVFHGATVEIGDYLGIREYLKSFYVYKEVVVFPKRVCSEQINNLVGGLIGNISVRRFICEDPILILGFREYTGHEPMKAISWKQSAKANSLIVNKFDYTTEPSVAIVLNMQCVKNNINALSKEQMRRAEFAISVARVICEQLDEKCISYSFTTNAIVAGGRRTRLSLNSGFGQSHLNSVLECLGRVVYDIAEPISETLYNARINSQRGRTTVVITPELFDELDSSIEFLKKTSECLLINVSEIKECSYE